MGRTRLRSMAPGLARLAAQRPRSLFVPAELASVRGIGALADLEELNVPAHVRLRGLARLRRLVVDGSRGRPRPVRLVGLPAVDELFLYAVRAIERLEIPDGLRVLDVTHGVCPDLRPLARVQSLRRLVLDGVSGEVALQHLAGASVVELDLWGCDLRSVAPLATMPNLREVWLNGNPIADLGPLLHLGPGAAVFVDPGVDPPGVAALEARGVRVVQSEDPHAQAHAPSWWATAPPP